MTLDRAFASLVGQTWRDWELIVIDDGSRDATPERVEDWRRRDPRVRSLRQPAAGIVRALNLGLAAAHGRFIARMDADDEALPARLERQWARLEGDPTLGLVSCLVEHAGDPVAQSGYARYVDWLNGIVTPEQIHLNRFVESPLAHPSVMFRRELVERLGGYREGAFPEDYELWLRWLEGGVRMAKVPEVLLRWHDRPDRLSRGDGRYSAEAFFRLKADFLARAARSAAEGRAIWVWGAGRPTRKRAGHLRAHGVEIAAYVDIDPRKVGRVLPGGQPVVSPAQLPSPAQAFILGYVSNPGARDLIRGRLGTAGFVEGQDFLMAA